MSKKVEDDRQGSNNVVAKLMGLETAGPLNRSGNESGNFHKHDIEDEIWDPKAKLSRKGKCGRSTRDKHMDLVLRKFMEAKDRVTEDRSKEFHEPLQVLSSMNNDLLLVKFLQESNSLVSQQHLDDFQPVPSHPEAKRITVLRPSNAVGAQECMVEDSKKLASLSLETKKIVVLKPCPGKALDIKAIALSPPPYSDDEIGHAETREMAKEITRQVRETFRDHRRNETLSSPSSSSVFSNAYIHRSNSKYPVGNISNFEIMSPPSSRHSCDCANRFESPFSSSSFSRVSFSPDSSVYREAKKRLSERWAMMSLNGDTQLQKNSPKASTALGEMFALSEAKMPIGSNEENNKVKQERSISCIGSGLDQVESASGSLNTTERSKSVPEIRVNGETSKAQAHREFSESSRLKSSWKVSSFFFFRNKKTNKENTDDAPSQLAIHCDAFQQQCALTNEGEVANENQDQPSPVSVLQLDFGEECSGSAKPWTTQGEEMCLKSNLIDKSPSIGSIARVPSWEDESSYTGTTKPAMGVEEDEDWYSIIKTLLKDSGFSGSEVHMTQWHSPDSPLDPSLRDNFANKELIRRREQRSNRKLVFDCVNDIIRETTSTLGRTGFTKGFDMMEHVWRELQGWAVSDEVVGKMWSSNSLQMEMNNLGIKIQVILLQELVEEAVFDLTP